MDGINYFIMVTCGVHCDRARPPFKLIMDVPSTLYAKELPSLPTPSRSPSLTSATREAGPRTPRSWSPSTQAALLLFGYLKKDTISC